MIRAVPKKNIGSPAIGYYELNEPIFAAHIVAYLR